MEFPHLGKHCHDSSCNRLDFLPVKCDACGNIFCSDHMTYTSHSCPSAYKKDIQVPICPLCGSPVPTPKNKSPDETVGEHIDNDCQSGAAKSKRKANFNRCSTPGCKVKEMVPVLCNQCKRNFCLRHRFPDDHKCAGNRTNSLEAAERRQRNNQQFHSSIQGSMSEDEALARALAESMKDTRAHNSPATNSAVTASNNHSQRCQLS